MKRRDLLVSMAAALGTGALGGIGLAATGNQLLQKRAVRIVAQQHRLAHTEHLFKNLKILKVDAMAKQQLLVFMHKKLLCNLPDKFEDLFILINPPSITTRSRNHFFEPFSEKLFRTRVSKWIGPRIWNAIIAPDFTLDSAFELSKDSLKKFTKHYFLHTPL